MRGAAFVRRIHWKMNGKKRGKQDGTRHFTRRVTQRIRRFASVYVILDVYFTLASTAMFGWTKKPKEFDELISELVRPELVEAMKSPDFNPPLNQLTTQKINYLVVAVDGSTANDIGAHIGAVADLAKECGWFGDFIFSNLVVLIDGAPLPKASPPSSRTELLSKITATLKDQCKTVGGEENVPWGNYGSPRRKAFGAMLPEFLGLVSQLHAQPFGTHAERNAR